MNTPWPLSRDSSWKLEKYICLKRHIYMQGLLGRGVREVERFRREEGDSLMI